MSFEKPPLGELKNESDVEQKFFYPLLTEPEPYGLGLPHSAIQTKSNIRRFKIGKGSDEKTYFPDHLVVLGGFPIMVCELKQPGTDLADAYREARLYAAELNAVYPSGINPVTRIVASDGRQTIAGPPDQAAPRYDVSYKEIDPYSDKFANLQSFCGARALQKEFARLSALVKNTNLKKPRRLLGGASIQHEEIGHNTFGATISADFAHIFNPVSREDRVNIAKHGYIPSKRRQRYVDPIDRVIRASRPPSETNSRLIEDTAVPTEIIETLKGARPLEHQVLLIVGNVGAGKSTFIDHLQEVALPRELINSTIWVHLNMNAAPISTTEIYDWLRREIISGCKAAYPSVDFDDLETLKSVFSVEVNRFNKGVGKLYGIDTPLYNQKLGEALERLDVSLQDKTIAFTRYCSTERGKLLVIVLDNCDKRLRNEQLLMFEAAQWVQKEFRALVVLPLREETYDNHRDQPPLDTALKDLVFRIEPPLFHNVLVTRVQMALNELSKSGPKSYRYDLPNGFHVEYAASDQAYYLTSIIRAIFEYDRHIRRMIVGLSGRNIRRALEIFLEFCTSGHIGEDQILKIRQAQGNYVLPLYLVVRVLLRLNRRFYDSDASYLKNLFSIDAKDTRPNYFTRLMILRWLLDKFSRPGPSGLKGYFSVGNLTHELTPYGTDELVVRREIEYLAKAQCILSEDFRVEALSEADSIRLAPAGFVHLELLSNVDYIAALAEDTWFEDEAVARRVADRIASLETQYQPHTAIYNAREVIEFLVGVQRRESAIAKLIVDPSHFDALTQFTDAVDGVARLEKSLTAPPWQDVSRQYPQLGEFIGIVVNVRSFGVFVELEPGVTGLIPASKLTPGFQADENFGIGDRVKIKILDVDPLRQRMGLEFISGAAD